MKKNVLIFFFLLGALCVGSVVLYKTGISKAEEHLSQFIQKEIKRQKINIKWEQMSLSFFPLKIHWQDVVLHFSDPLFLAPVRAQSLSLKLDWAGLLRKKLHFKATGYKLFAHLKLKTTHHLKKSKNQQLFLPVELPNLPLTHLVLKDSQVLIQSQATRDGDRLKGDNRLKPTLNLKQIDAVVRLKGLKITAISNVGFMQTQNRPPFSAHLNINIKKQSLEVMLFKLKNETSQLKLSGKIQGRKTKIRSGQVHLKGDFLMQDISSLVKIALPKFKNPIKGNIKIQGQARWTPSQQLKGEVDLRAKNLSIYDIFLSQALIRGNFKNKSLFLNTVKAGPTPHWQIGLAKSEVQIKKPFNFKANVVFKNSQLNALFNTFHLDPPLKALMSGKWACNGALLNKQANCSGHTQFKNFIVQEKLKTIILKVPKILVKGDVKLANNKFNLENQIILSDHSMLTATSDINEQGDFSSQVKGNIRLSDINDLVSLNPKGNLHIKNGTLKIHKNTVHVQSQIQTKDLILDQFKLGSAKAYAKYTKGILSFKKIKGQLKQSKYKGNVYVDILKNRIKAYVLSNFITLQDLKYALKERVPFPFKIRGKGGLSSYIEGPLIANQLSYTGSATFFNVFFEDESFDKAFIQLESKAGHVRTQKAYLTKGDGKLIFTAEASPNGQMQASLKGQNISLQTSENISRMANNDIEGDMNFQTNLNGYFLNPSNRTDIYVKNSFFKGYPIKDSNLSLIFKKNGVRFQGDLANKVRIQNWFIPYKGSAPTEIHASVHQLDIKELFSSKAKGSAIYNQLQSSVNGAVNLTYHRDQFAKTVTGWIKADHIFLKSPPHELKNRQPLSIQLNKGKIKIDPFILQSQKGNLSVASNEENIYVQSDLELSFFIFLLPFMKNFEGAFKTNLTFKPFLFNLSASGEAVLKNGNIQLAGGLDPFEDIYVLAQIENRSITLSSIYAKTGGGSAKGKGEIFIPQKEGLVIDIKGSFTETAFAALPGLFARGYGDFQITGKDFPYTLKINSQVRDIKIEKEFIAQGTSQVRLSQRLLSLQEDKKDFEPLHLQVQLNPKTPIRIENTTMRSSFTGRVLISGPPSNPLLTGDLKALPGGTLIFRDHEFNILSAQVHWTNIDPANPIINLRAKTALLEEDEDRLSHEYNVFLRVQGRGTAPQFLLTSTPSLTEREIISLLAFGARSIQLGTPLNNITRYSYSHLGPALFQKVIGRELKNTLGVVDQLLIIPHISSKTSTPATKLVMRKTIFKHLDLSSSHTLLDENRESDIKAKYKLNKNISVIGLWQNESPEEGRDEETNTLGLDLEYQVDF